MRLRVFLLSLILLITWGCAQPGHTEAASDPIIELHKSLSLQQKIGQMVLVYHSPYSFLAKHEFGGVLIMQSMLRSPQLLTEELREVQKKMKIPLLVTVDQEGGTVNRLASLPHWKNAPSAREISSWKDQQIQAYAERVGSDLISIGINTNLAPVLDPSINHSERPTYMKTKDRSFGVNGMEILRPARGFALGLREEGVQCISKHFPGYDVETNSDYEIAESQAEMKVLEERVKLFQQLNDVCVGTMMSSIHFKKITQRPAVLSPRMVAWARKVVGENLIMTDDLWGTALRSYLLPGVKIHRSRYPADSFRELVLSAVQAGNDMLMITYPQKAVEMISIISSEAKKNPQIMKLINDASFRILRNKQKLGLIARSRKGF